MSLHGDWNVIIMNWGHAKINLHARIKLMPHPQTHSRVVDPLLYQQANCEKNIQSTKGNEVCRQCLNFFSNQVKPAQIGMGKGGMILILIFPKEWKVVRWGVS